MENKEALLEEYRRQLQELTQKIDSLAQEPEAPTEPVENPAPAQPEPPVQTPPPAPQAPPAQTPPVRQQRDNIPQWQQRYAPQSRPQSGIPAYHPSRQTMPQPGAPVQSPPRFSPEAPRQPVPQPPTQNPRPARKLNETFIGKNLFAILASVLILVGVSIFIASIYDYIPTAVKVIFIYVLGGGMLVGGLALYSRRKNHFWLGVASCGLAELLLCIIASYSYFRILPLSGAFALILLWILGSLWLTKYQSVVFKTIGYVGLLISMWLGMSQLDSGDLVMHLALFGAYAALSTFFMLTTPQCKKTNTVISFCNLLQLCMFMNLDRLMPEGFSWVGAVLAMVVIAVYHGVYVWDRSLVGSVYPYFSMVSCLVLFGFCDGQEIQLIVPVMLFAIFAMWCGCLRYDRTRWAFTGFSMAFLALLSIGSYSPAEPVWFWFAWCAVAAYILYWLTRKVDIAWLGLALFLFAYTHVAMEPGWGLLVSFLAAIALFVLTGSKLLPVNPLLQSAWYAMVLLVSGTLINTTADLLHDFGAENTLVDGVINTYFLALAAINTGYLHFSLSKRSEKLGLRSVLLLVIQGFLLPFCFAAISCRHWFCALVGIVSSLLILSYSLHYLLTTKRMTKELLTWQFIKFTLYTLLVLDLLGSPGILFHILLLVIGILAIVVGIRLDYRAVRLYGLILSLVDVVSLVLFNIDYGNSIQLSLGIIACGVLCFVISFIYFRAEKSAEKDQNDPE